MQKCCKLKHYSVRILFWRNSPPMGQVFLIHEVSRSLTTTHHSRCDSSGRQISSSQRPLPYNTQHSQQTDIHAPGGIRTHNLSRRKAADLSLRPRGHWDRQCVHLVRLICNSKYSYTSTPGCTFMACYGANFTPLPCGYKYQIYTRAMSSPKI